MMSQFVTNWQKVLDEQVKQMENVYEQGAKLQAQGQAQSMQTFDELTRLAQAQMGYVNQLQEEWRKMSVEAMRQGAAMAATATNANKE